MPSPIGHSLAALLLRAPSEPKGWIRCQQPAAWWRSPITAVILGNLPDLDLIGSWLVSGHMSTYHHDFTHNVWLALAVGLLMALVTRPDERVRAGCWGFVLVSLHVLMDASVGAVLLGPTLGVPALWPLSDQHFGLPAAFVMMLHFGPTADILSWANVWALVHETLLFGIPLSIVLWLRK